MVRGAQLAGVLALCAVAPPPAGGQAKKLTIFDIPRKPLAQEHEGLDVKDKCDSCHVGDLKRVDDNKCLNCHEHKNLRARIRQGVGLHASTKFRGRRCHDCHVDHRGRKKDIINWKLIGGTKNFDHQLTRWTLSGAHTKQTCKRCHTTTNKAGRRVYLGETSDCVGCHEQVNPHGYLSAETTCDRCHSDTSWLPVKQSLSFDHERDTDFSLASQHANTTCAACHPGAFFALGRAQCADCHPIAPRFDLTPPACAECHYPSYD